MKGMRPGERGPAEPPTRGARSIANEAPARAAWAKAARGREHFAKRLGGRIPSALAAVEVATGCWALAGAALAQEVASPSSPGAETARPTSVPPPPPGFESKPPLSTADLERKREGGYVTGLPLLNFDPNTGVGFGARAYYYDNGERTDPLFAYTPYAHRVFLQAFGTTGGFQYHTLDYDAPSVEGTPYRVRGQLIFEKNTSRNFFGASERSLEPLTFTGATQTFGDYGDYLSALERVDPNGLALSRYNHFASTRYALALTLERTIFRGLVRPLLGLAVARTSLEDYTGDRVDAIDADGGDVRADQGPTLLREQCDADLLVGCDGGWDNTLRLGLALDTRDFEPDPNSGVLLESTLDLGTGALGSSFDYARLLVGARGFFSPMPEWADLVVAARGTLVVQSPGTPFFARNTLGGLRTIRGYRQDRFGGPVLASTNFELRWTPFHFGVAGQDFAPILIPFLDLGRPFDTAADLSLSGWKRGQGASVRIAWNQATIIAIDYGVSEEDAGLYINFDHQF